MSDSVESLRAALASARAQHESQSARALALLRSKDEELEVLRSPAVTISPATEPDAYDDEEGAPLSSWGGTGWA